MKRAKEVITKKGILKWLMNAVLVLGLITFSGYVSEFRLYNTGPAKTELSETRSVSSKTTVRFKKVIHPLHSSLLHSIGYENFTSFLFHQENRITVKLKSNFKELFRVEKQRIGFLLFYSIDREVSIVNQPRG